MVTRTGSGQQAEKPVVDIEKRFHSKAISTLDTIKGYLAALPNTRQFDSSLMVTLKEVIDYHKKILGLPVDDKSWDAFIDDESKPGK